MLTDDQARDLLRQAAATIEVGPARPVEPVRRRRPVLVALAAAAAVAVAAGTTVALTRGDTDPGPGTGPASSPAPGEASEEDPPGEDPTAEPGLAPGTVPVVFGYDEQAANELLTQAGAGRVVTEESRGCLQPGRALRTDPAAGAGLEAGAPVRLVVTATAPNVRCLGSDAAYWPLLEFARAGQAGPDWADEVTTAVDGERVVVDEPGDRAAWPAGSALDAVAQMPALTVRADGEPRMLFGFMPDDGTGRAGCRGASAGRDPGLPEGLAGRESQAYWLRHQDAGELGPCVVVNVFDRDGLVDGIVVRHLTWQAPEG